MTRSSRTCNLLVLFDGVRNVDQKTWVNTHQPRLCIVLIQRSCGGVLIVSCLNHLNLLFWKYMNKNKKMKLIWE